MTPDFFDINHRRLDRLFHRDKLKGTIHLDSVNPTNPSCHFIENIDGAIHAIPTYNLDNLDIGLYKNHLNNNKISAILPTFTNQNNNDSLIYYERPDLVEVNVSADIESQWTALHYAKRRSIKKMLRILRLEVYDTKINYNDLFIKSYLKIQQSRNSKIIGYFDKESLEDILELKNTRLFFAYEENKPNSFLFHIIFIVDKVVFFLFSSPTDDESRSYSAALHWFTMRWIINQKCYKTYSLGGGITKGDGVENFKLQLSGEPRKRYYGILPKVKYREGEFFPSSHNFLASNILQI